MLSVMTLLAWNALWFTDSTASSTTLSLLASTLDTSL